MENESLKNWYIILNGSENGPYSTNQLIEMLGNGKIDPAYLVWRKGFEDWAPLKAQLEFKTYLLPREDSLSAPVISSSLKSSKKFLALLGILIFSFMTFFIESSYLSKAKNPAFFFIWCTNLIISITLGFFLIWKFWKHLNEAIFLDFSRLSGYKILCVFASVSLIAFTINYVPNISAIYRINRARLAFADYTINVDVLSRSAFIEGPIGPGFAATLENELQIHNGVDTIFISSPGGLIDEALESAKLIEQKNISVSARKECNSSCLIILMAGRTKNADWDMSLGFHASSAITALDASDEASANELGDSGNAFLESHGVPAGIISAAVKKGPTTLEEVSAIDLKDQKVIDNLLDGEKVIPLDEAEWRSFEEAFSSKTDHTLIGLSKIFKTIRNTAPFIVSKHVNELYQASLENNKSKIIKSVFSLLREAEKDSILAADGKAVISYADNYAKQVDYLDSMQAWDACANYIRSPLYSGEDVLSKAYEEKGVSLFDELATSASENHWQIQPIPKWASEEARQIIYTIGQQEKTAGINAADFDKNNAVTCVTTDLILKDFLKQKSIEKAPLFRWLNTE